MNRSGRRWLLALLAGVVSCTDATLGLPPPAPVPAANNLLALTGSLCTEPASEVAFPVKILFLIDLSGSMCYSDPASGMCTAARCDQGPNNPLTNTTPPKRAQAVQEVISHFAGNPAVSFAVVTFSSSTQAYPYDMNGEVFTTDTSQLNLDSLRNVDSVTDDQGALSRVETLLSTDMANVAARDKSELPRTKYAILFLTDGTPFPSCSRADPDTNQPVDSPTCSTQPSTCTVCQVGGTASLFPQLGAGQDYNTTYQLVQIVNEMHQLADTYQVGDLKFHTALLRVPNAQICCPACFSADPAGTLASELLIALAQPDQNLGTFVQFTSDADISFLNYDFTSLEQQFAIRRYVVDNVNTVITGQGLQVDSDGDGLSDAREFALGTNPLNPDTDGDGYSDFFEVRHGPPFNPLVAQTGRCAAHSPKCPNGTLCDTDGDGLRDCEEAELGTDPELVDSDADGLPDGLEYRRGMDPTRDDTLEDLDFDGFTNLDELTNGTSVTDWDANAAEPWSIHLTLSPMGANSGGGLCYGFSEAQLQLQTPDSTAPQGLPEGWSDTHIWMSEAPQGDLKDYGRVRMACVRARYVPPALRLPLATTVSLQDSDFFDPSVFVGDMDCRGAQP